MIKMQPELKQAYLASVYEGPNEKSRLDFLNNIFLRHLILNLPWISDDYSI